MGEIDLKYMDDDLELIQGCLSRDRNSWEVFVKKYTKMVYFVINNINQSKSAPLNQEDIEDLHNDVFLALLEKKLSQFRGERSCSLASWVRIVTVSKTLNTIKSRQVRTHYMGSMSKTDDDGDMVVMDVEDQSESQEDIIIGEEGMSRLKEYIGSLAPRERFLMKLYYERELSNEQIAGMLEMSIGALYTFKHRVMKKLEDFVGAA